MKDTTKYEVYYFDSKKHELWMATKDYDIACEMIEEIKSGQRSSAQLNRWIPQQVLKICIVEVKKKVIKEVIL